MIFFRDRKLARRLKNNEVSSRDQFFYYLILSILVNAYLTYTLNSEAINLNIYTYMIDSITLIATTLSIFLGYIANNKGDKKDFVMRATCISFPIIVHTSIIGCILVLFSITLDIFNSPNLLSESDNQEDIASLSDHFQIGKFDLITTTILYAYYTWRTYTAMLIASGAKE